MLSQAWGSRRLGSEASMGQAGGLLGEERKRQGMYGIQFLRCAFDQLLSVIFENPTSEAQDVQYL